MLIIGFGNKSRQGKDTAAEAIKDHFDSLNRLHKRHIYKLAAQPVNVGIFKFATTLYAEVDEAIKNGLWETRLVHGEPFLLNPSGKTIVGKHYIMPPNATGRSVMKLPDWVQPDHNPEVTVLSPHGKHPKLLQWWGTEYRRKNFGESYWADKLFASIPSNTDIAVISDVRFLNEVDGIKQRGGYTVNVQRLREDGTQYYATDRPSDHPSETELDNYNWDYRIQSKEGDAGWTAEQAITLAEYLRGLK